MRELPVRILAQSADAGGPIVSVDGVFDAPGLHLSHWPGNRTPRALKHDLSTGCALAFARLPRAQRDALVGDAVAFANNHYDTDGSLALFAVTHPEAAVEHADALLAAAAAGDFFGWPDDRALAIDAIVSGVAHSAHSPLAAELDGLASVERWQRCTDYVLGIVPTLLDGSLEPWRALWEPVLAAARADRADLERCSRRDDTPADLTVWTAARNARSSRAGAGERFDPGRHALFGGTRADRVLVVGPGSAGASYRCVVSTRSWFDLVTERRLARPDLVEAARRLNALEGADAADASAWRAQAATNASPELWFGGPQLESFAEHNAALATSRLDPPTVERELGLATA